MYNHDLNFSIDFKFLMKNKLLVSVSVLFLISFKATQNIFENNIHHLEFVICEVKIQTQVV